MSCTGSAFAISSDASPCEITTIADDAAASRATTALLREPLGRPVRRSPVISGFGFAICQNSCFDNISLTISIRMPACAFRGPLKPDPAQRHQTIPTAKQSLTQFFISIPGHGRGQRATYKGLSVSVRTLPFVNERICPDISDLSVLSALRSGLWAGHPNQPIARADLLSKDQIAIDPAEHPRPVYVSFRRRKAACVTLAT